MIAGLFKGGFWVLIASFFGFGLLLALTPCVFPMIPILSGILVPHGAHLTHVRGFVFRWCTCLAWPSLMRAAGVAAGLLGTMLSSALQNVWVLSGFAAIFVLLALVDVRVLRVATAAVAAKPARGDQQQAARRAFRQRVRDGRAVRADRRPVCGCAARRRAAYISQSGDGVLGGAALFAMALGMGVPLLAVGASAGTLLPKAGPWMETVKRFFGVVLLGVAIYLVRRCCRRSFTCSHGRRC